MRFLWLKGDSKKSETEDVVDLNFGEEKKNIFMKKNKKKRGKMEEDEMDEEDEEEDDSGKGKKVYHFHSIFIHFLQGRSLYSS